MPECLFQRGDCGEEIVLDAGFRMLDDKTEDGRYSIRCYWVLVIRYWCLSEIKVNFICLLKKTKREDKYLPSAAFASAVNYYGILDMFG
jgi:hypothetical protein